MGGSCGTNHNRESGNTRAIVRKELVGAITLSRSNFSQLLSFNRRCHTPASRLRTALFCSLTRASAHCLAIEHHTRMHGAAGATPHDGPRLSTSETSLDTKRGETTTYRGETWGDGPSKMSSNTNSHPTTLRGFTDTSAV